MSDAFYLPTADPDVFLATSRTEGLWEPQTQHAGPPSALLTRAIERLPSTIPGPSQLARLTMEILGPIRTGEVRVRTNTARPGRAVELVEAELESVDRVVMRARAWRIRTAAIELPSSPPAPMATASTAAASTAAASTAAASTAPAPMAPPVPDAEATFRDPAWLHGYLGAVDFHFVHGHFEVPGPAAVWTRLRYPLVAGEEPTPTQRLMAAADSGNGLSSQFNFHEWWFINTELTVHLVRPPVGEWVYVDARSTMDRSGVGLAETDLYDATGRVGRGAQSLMVGPRSG